MGAAIVLLAAATAPASAAVFGRDDRSPVGADRRDLAANVGVLYNRERTQICTAFCVGHRTIVTAAHCVSGRSDVANATPPDVTFELAAKAQSSTLPAAPPTGAVSSRLGGQASRVMGSPTLRLKPPIDSTRDWAVVRLEKPICTAGGLRLSTLPAADVRAAPSAAAAINLAIHKDRLSGGILVGTDCGIGRRPPGIDAERIAREFTAPENLLLHTCDTAGGSSGSPLIVDGRYGPEVIGINVGSYVQSTVLLDNGVVISRTSSQTIANTAASAAPIAQALDAFDADEPVSDWPSQLELAERLHLSGDDGGAEQPPQDHGRDDKPLQRAVRAYQAREGLPATGIATRRLLQRLRDTAPATIAAPAGSSVVTGSTR